MLSQAYAPAQGSLILQVIILGLLEPMCLQVFTVVAALKRALAILLMQKQPTVCWASPALASGLDMPDGALQTWPPALR